MAIITENCRPRHTKLMRALKETAARAGGEHDRVVILVYDGPSSLIRECSWAAPDSTPGDAKRVMEATAAQILA